MTPQNYEAEDAAFTKAREVALRFLAYRARSAGEIKKRLGREYAEPTIERVIDWLKQHHYLDDLEFARQWRRQRERLKPKGQRAIRQELLQLSVGDEVIAEALDGFDAESNAYRAGWKRARQLHSADYNRFRQRLWSYLERRGFEFGVINDTITRLWQELSSDPLDRSVNSDSDEEYAENAEAEGVNNPANQEGADH